MVTGLTGNSNFSTLPVDLATLKANIESFHALIVEALDGSRKVIAQKNKQREAVIKMLRLLARYVEVTSDGDMAIFTNPTECRAIPRLYGESAALLGSSIRQSK